MTCTEVNDLLTRADHLLVFRPVDQPEAGVQVPGGSLEPSEDLLTGAVREAQEETGQSALEPVAYLGSRRVRLDDEPNGSIERHYFHLQCREDTPERWTAWEHDPSDGSPGPIAFEHAWAPLSAVPRLCPGMGDLLHVIGGIELDAPQPHSTSG